MELLSDDHEHDVVLDGTFEMLDSATDSLVEYPVTVYRSQKVIRIEDGKAVIQVTTKNTTPFGQLPSGFGGTVIEFAVDAATRTYATYKARFMIADELRVGYFTFPPDAKAGTEYPIWIEEMMQPLPARYEGEKQVDGMKLYTYVIDAKGVTVWSDSHGQADSSGDVHIIYSVEPRTGVVVDQQSRITRQSLSTGTAWQTTFASALGFTPETVSKNLETAKANRSRLVVTGTWVPWSLVGSGILVAVAGCALAAASWQRLPGQRAATSRG